MGGIVAKREMMENYVVLPAYQLYVVIVGRMEEEREHGASMVVIGN